LALAAFNHNRSEIASDVRLTVSRKKVLANNFVKKENNFAFSQTNL
jgi:hypothetical protein